MTRRYDAEQLLLIEIFADAPLRNAVAAEAAAYSDYEAACDDMHDAAEINDLKAYKDARERQRTASEAWEKAARHLHEVEIRDAQ